MDILILIFAVIYTILAKLRLDWAIMFLIAALPTYLIRFQVLGIPFTLLEAMILISFTVWLCSNISRIISNIRKSNIREYFKRKDRYPFDIELILLLIISWIAIAVAGFTDSAMGAWKAYFFEPVLVFILILNLFKKKNGFNKILWALTISALAVSVIAIYQKFTGAWIMNEFWAAEETRRVTSFFGYPNAVGLYLGPLALVIVGWLAKKINVETHYHASLRTKIKIFFIFLIIFLLLLSIYFAKSEGALIAVVVGMIVFGLLAGKKIRWATVAVVMVAGIGIITYAPVKEYAINKITLNDLSGQIRKQQWKETMEMLRGWRIITGTGLANYQTVIEPYHQEGIFFNKDNDPEFHRHVVWNKEYRQAHWQPVEIYLYPHNIFINFWTELGIGGMLLFIWIIGKYFVISVRALRARLAEAPAKRAMPLRQGNRYLVLGLICAMVVIIVHGIVDVPYLKNDLAVMFWVLIAMMSSLDLELKNKFLL